MRKSAFDSRVTASGFWFVALVAMATVIAQPSTCFGQGSLNPPGPPAGIFKTLDQIEPRIPLDTNTAPGDATKLFSINNAGSYYLTTNIFGVSGKYGIGISANNVTLDLNGFAMAGVTNALDGIVIFTTFTNITIRNGTLSGWGIGNYGIRSLAQNVTFERLTICVNNFGMSCNSGSVVRDCVINGNQRDGIDVNGSDCLILNNVLAKNNLANGPGNASISINGTNHRLESNHVNGNGSGFGISILFAFYTNNIVIKNSVIGNGVNNYSISSGNIVGPIINTTGTITNSNPWANFSF